MENAKNTAFIICEYNPFHNGHAYHIAETRKAGADRVVCIMSGNFVQRGEPAFFDKYVRTEAALLNGADLVLELPVKYAVSNAARFAAGAVSVMQKCNIGGFLSFGASADVKQLAELSEIVNSDEFRKAIGKISETTGKSFPASSEQYISEIRPELSVFMRDPNNLLALEYISNLKDDCEFLTVNRSMDHMHDSDAPQYGFASGKFLRSKLKEEGEICEAADYIPENTVNIFVQNLSRTPDSKKYESAFLSRLLLLSQEDYLKLDNVIGGLENRLYNSVRKERTLQRIYDAVKTKRFTHSRIRQIYLSAVLGILKSDLENGVSYIRVLGFNDTGKEILREMRKSALCPIAVNLSDVSMGNDTARDAFLEASADAFYGLCLPDSYTPYDVFRYKPVIKTSDRIGCLH